MAREESPLVFRVLFDGRTRNQVTTTVIRGAPVLQEVFAIRNERGETIGALRSEMLLIEHERQRKRDARFRRAIARTRDLIVPERPIDRLFPTEVNEHAAEVVRVLRDAVVERLYLFPVQEPKHPLL